MGHFDTPLLEFQVGCQTPSLKIFDILSLSVIDMGSQKIQERIGWTQFENEGLIVEAES